MTRVLFFSTSSSPVGGVETWLDRTCVHLAQHGFEPVVGLARGLKHNLPENFRKYHPQLECIEIDGRGLDREGRVRALCRSLDFVKPDIALPMSLYDGYEAICRTKHRLRKLKLAVHAQGNLPAMLADLRAYRSWIDLIVCPGRLAQQLLISWGGFEPHRTKHIPNGADPPLRMRPDIPCRSPVRLGYVGRLTRHDKRSLDLIPLCEQLTALEVPFHLHIVGDGPCRQELEEGLAPYKDAVSIHGALDHHSVYEQILPELDILLMLSASEAFGIILAEAMMHGVVPVTSEYIGFHAEQLCVSGEHGLVFPVGQMQFAAKAIGMLALDDSLYLQYSLAAREHAQQYTWDTSVTRWELAFKELSDMPVVSGSQDSRPQHRTQNQRLLDRMGIPASALDAIRRLRRRLLGSPVPPGGEEWPLFHKDHPQRLIQEISDACLAIENRCQHVSENS